MYLPLFLFLSLAIIGLFKSSIDVFSAPSNFEYIERLASFKQAAEQYRENCLVKGGVENKCIENYLNDELFAEIETLNSRYADLGNSYSTVAIMTGFFGVLMTVLIIYFSLSGREAIQLKLDATENLLAGASDALTKAVVASKKAQEVSSQMENTQKVLDSLEKEFKSLETSIKKETPETIQNSVNIAVNEAKAKLFEEMTKVRDSFETEVKSLKGELDKQKRDLLVQEADIANIIKDIKNRKPTIPPVPEQQYKPEANNNNLTSGKFTLESQVLTIFFENADVVQGQKFQLHLFDGADKVLGPSDIQFDGTKAKLPVTDELIEKLKNVKKISARFALSQKSNDSSGKADTADIVYEASLDKEEINFGS